MIYINLEVRDNKTSKRLADRILEIIFTGQFGYIHEAA